MGVANKPLILLVDDQPQLLLTLAYLVQRIGDVEVVTVNNGKDAIETAVDRKPDLILMDVMMPQMDGYTASERIREAWGEQHAGRIWIVTARKSHLDHEKARQAGADLLITKPYDPEKLIQQISQELSLKPCI